ncbi:MAG: NYN domain-containing protein [Elusimicrobiota bacterium]|jgi:predicted RNA-binding protein with PIN domain|nr:NYN domain-containing protein [Elusimicrobiota bacterium]
MKTNYASKKPAVYIIDGLNFIRGFVIKNGSSAEEETLTAELISWLDELGRGELYASQFRIILDGVYRNVGHTRTNCVNAQFADGCSADEIIREQAAYLKQNGERVIVVTSDLELGAKIKQLGVKVIGCGKFFNSFYN